MMLEGMMHFDYGSMTTRLECNGSTVVVNMMCIHAAWFVDAFVANASLQGFLPDHFVKSLEHRCACNLTIEPASRTHEDPSGSLTPLAMLDDEQSERSEQFDQSDSEL
jgi:hypothetical protein